MIEVILVSSLIVAFLMLKGPLPAPCIPVLKAPSPIEPLPKGITRRGNKFWVRAQYKKQKITGTYSSLEGAEKFLRKSKDDIDNGK